MSNDFSIREEVRAALQNLEMKMTEEQIDEVVDEIQQYDTFLSVVSLFVLKGTKDVLDSNKVKYDQEKIEQQIIMAVRGINPDDLA
ncbi:hypothetical protein [Heyndrickxia sporothermodurans]|uniref:hypothetical protein n=1 Tax=Heyndrickxia sporothermodurans TaxID=46224 RepID=UPI000D358178|nr:hypothetical protein [Heyndrickxia sporothermodurans]PTY93038.1 hypothetical protein B5V90_02845 [Heyndrickxia sporothermodurans]